MAASNGTAVDERVLKLREQLTAKKLDAYVIPTADAHMVRSVTPLLTSTVAVATIASAQTNLGSASAVPPAL